MASRNNKDYQGKTNQHDQINVADDQVSVNQDHQQGHEKIGDDGKSGVNANPEYSQAVANVENNKEAVTMDQQLEKLPNATTKKGNNKNAGGGDRATGAMSSSKGVEVSNNKVPVQGGVPSVNEVSTNNKTQDSSAKKTSSGAPRDPVVANNQDQVDNKGDVSDVQKADKVSTKEGSDQTAKTDVKKSETTNDKSTKTDAAPKEEKIEDIRTESQSAVLQVQQAMLEQPKEEKKGDPKGIQNNQETDDNTPPDASKSNKGGGGTNDSETGDKKNKGLDDATSTGNNKNPGGDGTQTDTKTDKDKTKSTDKITTAQGEEPPKSNEPKIEEGFTKLFQQKNTSTTTVGDQTSKGSDTAKAPTITPLEQNERLGVKHGEMIGRIATYGKNIKLDPESAAKGEIKFLEPEPFADTTELFKFGQTHHALADNIQKGSSPIPTEYVLLQEGQDGAAMPRVGYKMGYLKGYRQGYEQGLRLKAEKGKDAKTAQQELAKTHIHYKEGVKWGYEIGLKQGKGEISEEEKKIRRNAINNDLVDSKAKIFAAKSPTGEDWSKAEVNNEDGTTKQVIPNLYRNTFVQNYRIGSEKAKAAKPSVTQDPKFLHGYHLGHKIGFAMYETGGNLASGFALGDNASPAVKRLVASGLTSVEAVMAERKKAEDGTLANGNSEDAAKIKGGFYRGYAAAFQQGEAAKKAAKEAELKKMMEDPAFKAGEAAGNLAGILAYVCGNSTKVQKLFKEKKIKTFGSAAVIGLIKAKNWALLENAMQIAGMAISIPSDVKIHIEEGAANKRVPQDLLNDLEGNTLVDTEKIEQKKKFFTYAFEHSFNRGHGAGREAVAKHKQEQIKKDPDYQRALVSVGDVLVAKKDGEKAIRSCNIGEVAGQAAVDLEMLLRKEALLAKSDEKLSAVEQSKKDTLKQSLKTIRQNVDKEAPKSKYRLAFYQYYNMQYGYAKVGADKIKTQEAAMQRVGSPGTPKRAGYDTGKYVAQQVLGQQKTLNDQKKRIESNLLMNDTDSSDTNVNKKGERKNTLTAAQVEQLTAQKKEIETKLFDMWKTTKAALKQADDKGADFKSGYIQGYADRWRELSTTKTEEEQRKEKIETTAKSTVKNLGKEEKQFINTPELEKEFKYQFTEGANFGYDLFYNNERKVYKKQEKKTQVHLKPDFEKELKSLFKKLQEATTKEGDGPKTPKYAQEAIVILVRAFQAGYYGKNFNAIITPKNNYKDKKKVVFDDKDIKAKDDTFGAPQGIYDGIQFFYGFKVGYEGIEGAPPLNPDSLAKPEEEGVSIASSSEAYQNGVKTSKQEGQYSNFKRQMNIAEGNTDEVVKGTDEGNRGFGDAKGPWTFVYKLSLGIADKHTDAAEHMEAIGQDEGAELTETAAKGYIDESETKTIPYITKLYVDKEEDVLFEAEIKKMEGEEGYAHPELDIYLDMNRQLKKDNQKILRDYVAKKVKEGDKIKNYVAGYKLGIKEAKDEVVKKDLGEVAFVHGYRKGFETGLERKLTEEENQKYSISLPNGVEKEPPITGMEQNADYLKGQEQGIRAGTDVRLGVATMGSAAVNLRGGAYKEGYEKGKGEGKTEATKNVESGVFGELPALTYGADDSDDYKEGHKKGFEETYWPEHDFQYGYLLAHQTIQAGGDTYTIPTKEGVQNQLTFTNGFMKAREEALGGGAENAEELKEKLEYLKMFQEHGAVYVAGYKVGKGYVDTLMSDQKRYTAELKEAQKGSKNKGGDDADKVEPPKPPKNTVEIYRDQLKAAVDESLEESLREATLARDVQNKKEKKPKEEDRSTQLKALFQDVENIGKLNTGLEGLKEKQDIAKALTEAKKGIKKKAVEIDSGKEKGNTKMTDKLSEIDTYLDKYTEGYEAGSRSVETEGSKELNEQIKGWAKYNAMHNAQINAVVGLQVEEQVRQAQEKAKKAAEDETGTKKKNKGGEPSAGGNKNAGGGSSDTTTDPNAKQAQDGILNFPEDLTDIWIGNDSGDTDIRTFLAEKLSGISDAALTGAIARFKTDYSQQYTALYNNFTMFYSSQFLMGGLADGDTSGAAGASSTSSGNSEEINTAIQDLVNVVNQTTSGAFLLQSLPLTTLLGTQQKFIDQKRKDLEAKDSVSSDKYEEFYDLEDYAVVLSDDKKELVSDIETKEALVAKEKEKLVKNRDSKLIHDTNKEIKEIKKQLATLQKDIDENEEKLDTLDQELLTYEDSYGQEGTDVQKFFKERLKLDLGGDKSNEIMHYIDRFAEELDLDGTFGYTDTYTSLQGSGRLKLDENAGEAEIIANTTIDIDGLKFMASGLLIKKDNQYINIFKGTLSVPQTEGGLNQGSYTYQTPLEFDLGVGIGQQIDAQQAKLQAGDS